MDKPIKWTVYCHTHIESGRHYIGLTKLTIVKRWNRHVYAANKVKDGKPYVTSHFPNAIRKYGKEAFTHHILGICNTIEAANLVEECWIYLLETRNPEKGFNIAKGGACKSNPIRKNPWSDPEYRAKSLAAVKLKLQDPMFLANLSSASKLMWQDSDFKSRMSQISKEINSRPEVKAKISAANLGRIHSPEARAKIRTANLGKTRSEQVKNKMSEILLNLSQNPEYIAKLSAASKSKWADPNFRLKFSLSNKSGTPAVRKKLSLKFKGKIIGQETKQKLSEFYRLKREQRPFYATHYLCKHHGPVLYEDCYRYVRKNGNTGFICKLCKAQSAKRGL